MGPVSHPSPSQRPIPVFANVLKAIFGSRNDRLLKQYRKSVDIINALEPAIEKLSDEALAAKTPELRAKVAGGTPLDEVLPEAFAVVREASKRVLGMRHFDVQLIGGLALHEGKIAEMRTGEGKTLVATLPSYLNALTGKGVHVVTVNDYLARRDAEWMGRIHRFLGLTVGVVVPSMDHAEKQAAYLADITYGTNNEFGFDYLRDNMATQVAERFQRGLNYAIVDEVDSILIDEARTPLIISGQAEDSTDLYRRINALIPSLVKQEDEKAEGDYWVDLKLHNVTLSEQGHEHAEELMTKAGLLAEGASLYDPANIMLMHHLYAGVRAHALYHRDQHYVVQGDEVVIVDEFTGRMMAGRRWSDGLHQAVEAKEGVAIKNESQTLASITFQNYFRLYKKLAGMTGTADTEAFEFSHIYSLETVLIPTHRPMIRKDSNDQVFITAKEKYQAIIEEVKDCHERSQPVLLGTTSIENSELISSHAREGRAPAPGAQRQAARARGRDRHPGGPAEDDHHRHQHGGPRHRHRAGRQPRPRDPAHQGRRGDRRRGEGIAASRRSARTGSCSTTKWSPPGACTSSAPSATSRGASTTSCAAARRARATRAPPASSCPSRTRCSRSSPASACRR